MDKSPSQAVISAVADAEGVDPTDLPPLYEAIDPEALDRLLPKNGGRVKFNYHSYRVTVGQRDVVELEDLNSEPPRGRESVDAYRVMETAREGISLVALDGTFSFVNSAFASLFEFNRNELLGEHWTVLYHNEEAKRLEEDILPAVRETGYWSGETVRLTKRGEPRVTDHRLALTDEEVVLCTATDITLDRTATGLDVRDFEDSARDLEDSAFFTIDHEGYVTRWDEAAERLVGYEPTEILGKHVSTLFSPEDRERGLPDQLLDTAHVQGRASDEGCRIRNDENLFRTDVTMFANYDDAGTIRGFGTVLRESSERPANS